MALIKCTECGKVFSEKADKCPNCGCPVSEMDHPQYVDTNGDPIQPEETKLEQKKNDISIVQREQTTKKGKKKLIIGICVAAGTVVVVTGVYFGTANMRAYKQAERLYTSKKYEQALTAYNQLGDYKDSTNKAKECNYQIANSAYENENYQNALNAYNTLGDYKDSAKKAKDCEYQLSVDGAFMRRLSKALVKRWDLSDSSEIQELSEGEQYEKCSQVELDALSDFANKTFDDEKLGELAKQYIDLLNQGKEATTYENVDYTKFITEWNDVYSKRTQLLQQLVNDYGLTVDKKHQDTLDSLLKDATASAKLDSAKEAIHKMCDSFKITMTADEWGNKTYKVSMTNTTEYTFSYFYCDISLLDGNGTIVDSGQINQMSNWTPGQSAEQDAWLNGQSDPSQYTVQYTPHYQSGTMYE